MNVQLGKDPSNPLVNANSIPASTLALTTCCLYRGQLRSDRKVTICHQIL